MADKGQPWRIPCEFLQISDIQPLFITQVWILLFKVLAQIINDSLNPKCVKVVKIHVCSSTALKKDLEKIINNDQTGYIKNIFIGFNHRQIQDITDFAESYNVEGVIVCWF
jgi:hypothetical protein